MKARTVRLYSPAIPVTDCPAGTCPASDPYHGAANASTPPFDLPIQYPPVFRSAAIPAASPRRVGPATRARLARPYVPAPRYRLATASLEVNLAKQVTYYVRNGTIQRIIDSSTGSGAWY